MNETINGYRLLTEFTNSNAGMCQWAFAEKHGRNYFIKQFLSPKYPTAAVERALGAPLAESMRSEANEFYLSRNRYYEQLSACDTGNIVIIREFFRADECYYAVSERVLGPFLTVNQISKLPDEKKRIFLKTLLYSVKEFHKRGIVHSDLKPENILVRQTSGGAYAAKLIDFDSGFFEYAVPDEIIGDLRYFSPEVILRNDGRNVDVTVKSDIFSLGLLFHQYWCGKLPAYDRDEYPSASVALLNHASLMLSPNIPSDLRKIIQKMLEKKQQYRPDAQELWRMLLPGQQPGPFSDPFRPPDKYDLL